MRQETYGSSPSGGWLGAGAAVSAVKHSVLDVAAGG